MANGYLRIKKTDIYEDDGVIYWKNGANIIGNVVKCVDSEETEHYYIESLKTKKAILLDNDVKIGGGDFGFESTNGNFILVTTDVVDFSDIGGGNGVSITFTFENKYYTVTLPEDNGDLKIYDPDGEGGETGADPLPDVTDASAGDVLVLDEDKNAVWSKAATKYTHIVKIELSNNGLYYVAMIVNNSSTPFTLDTYKTYLDNYASVNTPIIANGYQGLSSGNTKTFIDSIIGKSGSNYIYHGTKINLVDSTITPNETVTVPLGAMTSIHDTVY